MLKNFIISFLIIINLITAAFCFGFHDRLERTRQQLEHVRMELSAATDRQYEFAEILRRDGEILGESFNTISGIRSQIAAIRKSYEEMENLLYDTRNNDTNYYGDSNNEKVKDE